MVKQTFLTAMAAGAVTLQLAPSTTLDFNSVPRMAEGELPPLYSFVARDGESLSYRLYGTSKKNFVMLLHGSGSHGGYLDFLAREFSAEATVCVPTMRGHYKSGSKRGTCSYVGQLEDDLADLLAYLGSESYERICMAGHSSGGGLAIRFAGGKYGDLVQRYALLAPVVPAYKPLARPGSNWVTVATIKIPLLVVANMLGISWFNDTQVITFNMPQPFHNGTETLSYSYNLLFSMNPRFDVYEKDVAALGGRAIVLVARHDECLRAEAYADLFTQVPVYIFEELNHFTLVRDPEVIARIREFCFR